MANLHNTKPSALLIHGHSLPETFDPLVEAFKSDFARIRCPDRYRGPHRADDLESTLCELEGVLSGLSGPRILVGHGFGAYLSLLVANRGFYPIDGLVLLSPCMHYSDENCGGLFSHASALDQGADLGLPMANRWFSRDYLRCHPEVVDFTREGLSECAGQLAKEMRWTEDLPDLRPYLSGLALPMLQVSGSEDRRICRPPRQCKISQVILQDVGSMVGMEAPDRVAGQVGQWWDQVKSEDDYNYSQFRARAG